jgi:glucosamine--fructose-6-phosphate aminotransferase (isomerizing)
MHEHHPLLANILSLARAETWASADLSDRAIVAWLRESDRCDWTRVYFVGCGTSLYAGQVGECVMEHLAHLPSKAVPGFAFAAYAQPALLGPEALVVGISATGNTEAVVNALARASQAGASTLALTADAGSKVTEVAEATIPVSGPLTTSVTTRSYVQTLAALYRLALRLAKAGREDQARTTDRWQEQIVRAADVSRRFLEDEIAHMEELARQYATAATIFVLGTGPNVGTAKEASLKVIEMAKVYSEAQELENFLHGRLREVDRFNPILLIAPHGAASQRVLDVLTVFDYVGAPSVVFTNRLTPGIERLATHVVHLPGQLDELTTPLVTITPLYLFAYYLARHRGHDPGARRYAGIVPQEVRYGRLGV